ncbi:MAG: hypothetical protein JXA30_14665 [Deltaproteobacteria bacterium]|nr:hypothetical protein [Deltaproteobacteria bacterium]
MQSSRRIILIVIALLLISEVASQIKDIFGVGPGVVGGLLVAVVQWYFARKAKAHVKYYLYIMVPTILFTVIPTGIRIWNFFQGEETALIRKLWEFGPIFISFILPVFLLLYVYWDLRPRE